MNFELGIMIYHSLIFHFSLFTFHFLRSQRLQDAQHDVEHHDDGQSRPFRQDDDGGAGKDETVAQAVVLPLIVMELQCKHRHLAHQQPATQQY